MTDSTVITGPELEALHFPEHTESALSEIEGIRYPLAEYHTVVLERRYDEPSFGFVIILLGDETKGDMRQATLGWGPSKWALEVLYQLSKKIEGDVAPDVTMANRYSEWPEGLRRYVHSCVIPMEWKSSEVSFLDERLFAFPLRGGDLQEPKLTPDNWYE